jgi:hypothetical protein
VFPAMKEVNDIMMKIFKAGLDAGVEATIRVLAKKN